MGKDIVYIILSKIMSHNGKSLNILLKLYVHTGRHTMIRHEREPHEHKKQHQHACMGSFHINFILVNFSDFVSNVCRIFYLFLGYFTFIFLVVKKSRGSIHARQCRGRVAVSWTSGLNAKVMKVQSGQNG